ncbi:uncharacterized protein LOC111319610, partial [Stylophora pistillata]|uniref:uncharacterized protein LOC111319610 n=1 Tax=Stylophora pistillata TaxID=50429 RepID=UPI000C041BB7
DESLRVALVKCSKDSSDPGGSQTAARNAVTLLRPKVTALVGFCYSPSPEKAQLGDVVISSKLTTDCHQTPVSRDVGKLVKTAAYGWKAPLENPQAQEVKVKEGEILSCSDMKGAEQQCQSHPGAIAVEMTGKGLFAAAHDMKMEWLVVKGVCDFVHGSGFTKDSWKTFACVMAASVVSNIFGDSSVFEVWPHYGNNLAREGSGNSDDSSNCECKRVADNVAREGSGNSDDSSNYERKRVADNIAREGTGNSDDSSNYKRKRVAEYSPEETFDVKSCRDKLAEHYKRTATVPTSVWSKACPVKIDQIYTRLSVVKEEPAPSGSSHSKLNHYTELFIDGEGNTQKRILVQGQTGIGKTTFVKKVAVDWAELNDENTELDVKLAESPNYEVESNDGSVKGLDEIQKQVLKRFELVLLVNLKEASKCQTLEEVLYHCNIFPEEDSALVDEMLSYIAKNQEKVLLMFDGYDEYGCGRNSEIFDIFRRKKLRSCCVLITTRISKADELRESKDVYAEVTGFSEWDRFSFMCRFLGSETEAEELMGHLVRENLTDLAKIPLLLLFFCTLWKKGRVKSFPDTKTNLYLAIVQCIVDYNQGKSSPAQFSKLEDLQDILAEIGKVALECLLEDDHVFEYDQLSTAILCEESRIIGLLQVTEYSENLRPAGMVSFIHKSIQEFLAAWYITYRCIPEKCLGGVEKHALTLESCAAWENVFQFICGLSNDGAVVVLDHFTSVRIATPDLDLSKTVLDVESNTDPPFNDLTYRQVMFNDLVFNSLQEVQSKGELLQRCFYCLGSVILVTTSLSRLLEKMERETVGRVTNSTVFVYESSLRVPVWALYRLVKILRCPQSFELLTVEKFLQMLTDDRTPVFCSNFRCELFFRNDELQFYFTRLTVECSEFVELFNASFGASASSGSEDTGIENSAVKFLRSFQCNCILEEKAREALGVIIRHCKSLKRIRFPGKGYHVSEILKQVPNPSECFVQLGATLDPLFDELHLSTAEIEELAKLLPRFHNIINLCVKFFPWTTKAIDTLVTSLTHHSFEVLILRGIQLTSAVVRALGRSLPDMSSLQVLELTGSGQRMSEEEDMERLFGGFYKTMPLRMFAFTGFSIETCIVSISKCFSFFPFLTRLDLGNFSDFNHDDFQLLLWNLRCSSELENVRVRVQPQDPPHCWKAKFNKGGTLAHKNLRALTLEGMRLTPTAAAILGRSLSEMPLLEQLEITCGVNEEILQEE